MTTQWQGPHYIAVVAASALAFGGGYWVAGRSRAPVSPPLATNTSNGVEPSGIPGFDTNGQAPGRRPDENELIARNAEPLDDADQGAGNRSGGSPPAERRPVAPPRAPQDDSKPPPSESVEDDQGFDPGDR